MLHIANSAVQVEKPDNMGFHRFRVVSAVGRFGHESFRPWVVSAGSFRPGSFRLDFRVGRFGLFWWVVSARSPPPIFYNINGTALCCFKVQK